MEHNAPPAPAASSVPAKRTASDSAAARRLARSEELRTRLAACSDNLTPNQQRACEVFVATRNKVHAWRVAYGHEGRKNVRDYSSACEVLNRPACLTYIRELEAVAAANILLDVQALLDKDRAIVEAADHANDLSRIVYTSCRRCYGVDHKYQWVDLGEYLEAVTKVQEQNSERAERKVRLLAEPDDTGGFGYDPNAEPNIACPACEGAGQMRTVWADTTKLGPAAALYRGIKQGANGQLEVLTHDVDKAKERLLRAAGVFKDDAASVARGAAAGAAAGAAVATAAAAGRVANGEPMTAEQAQRLYQELAG